MSSEEQTTMSKSARKRANQKARAAEAAAEAAPPAPEPAPKSKAAAKPKAEPKAEAKAEAKSKAKAKAAPAAEAPAPKADAKAKAKGKAAPAPKEEPKPEPKPEAKSKAASKKAAAKPKAAKQEEEVEPEKPKKEELINYVMDDGKGGDWEVSSGLSKKQERQQQRKKEEQAAMTQAKKEGAGVARGGQYIPGMVTVEESLAAAKAKGKAKAANQSVTAISAVTAAAAANQPEKVADTSTSVTIKVPGPDADKKIGRVVGPKGSNIQLIKEKASTEKSKIKGIDIAGEIITIVGDGEAVATAEHAIRSLIEKGYMALGTDNFEESTVSVYPTVFPDLIGSKGVNIMEIKKVLKVEITIPPVPKTAPMKKYKVTIAGAKENVLKAQEVVQSIAMYGHHEITHPGMVHQEMEVEEWRYRFLIGSKGSEMRHIQNNYKVKVNIPRETSECRNVVIVGEPKDCERAVAYIERVLYEADQPRGRGAADKAEDTWGDEGDVEDWMKPYMYNRK